MKHTVSEPARCFLFLQGHPSRFWRDLGATLSAAGQEVRRIDFCLADRVFWRGTRDTFRGRFIDWPLWLQDYVGREGVTDILYYADRHPYHVAAREIAGQLGLGTWAIEHGYLRPDWLTLEPGGMGAYSGFPRTREGLAEWADGQTLPEMAPIYGHPFAKEAWFEVTFHLLQALGRPIYPRFVSDRKVWPAVDYLSWLPELALGPRREREAVRVLERDGPFTLVPLQLEVDYQIRASSPYDGLVPFLEDVLASFAERAPANQRLVVKVHPLDNGLGRWFRRVPRLAAAHGVADRVDVIRGGDLNTFLTRSMGTVLVNSTVGIHALRAGVPVCAMGSAVFDTPGLTHQGGLDTFWTAPESPAPSTVDAFLRAMMRIQVRGSFFDPVGRAEAVAEMARRLTNRPPALAHASA